ncbi:MAG: PQQ-binding-like beta-propeller repeat protein [Haloferacaceae archaeon]
MTDDRTDAPTRRRFLRATVGLSLLGGCGTDGGPDTGSPRSTATATPTPTPRPSTTAATPAATRTTPRPRPRFEAGPATCSLAPVAPAPKTWPGAGYDAGATRHPPVESAPNGLPLRTAWTVPSGVGPVLVDRDRYYLRTETALAALSPADGRVRWRRRAAGPAGGAVVGDDLVALPTGEGTVFGLDPRDGSVRWTADVGAAPTCPPILTHGAVVLGTDAGVVAYARAAGEPCFRVPTAGPVTHLVGAGGLVVAATARPADGTLLAVDPGRETIRYTRYLTAPPTGLVATGDELIVSAGDGSLGLAPADGTPEWTASVGPVLAAGRHRYALGSDELVALSADGRAAWRADAPAPTGVAATDDLVVVTGADGQAAMGVYDARTGDPRLRQRDATGYRHPVVADDRIVVIGDDGVRVYREETT